MCLIAWNWNPGPDGSLLLVANRDEYYARPALPLHWWADGKVLAGKDQTAGGTWLGAGNRGRLAALTNYRQPGTTDVSKPSRGQLVADFLRSDMDAAAYLGTVAGHAGRYNPFNLLVFDGQRLLGLESRLGRIIPLPAGLGAVSNAAFHTPWPKLVRLQHRLSCQIQKGRTEASQLWPLLHDRTQAQDHELPDTGIEKSLEKALSSAFIALPAYGTRACSIVKLDARGGMFWEQSHNENGLLSEARFEFSTARS